MNDAPRSHPYAAPPAVYAPGETSPGRPTGVTVVGVICLLAGIVGLLSGLMSLVGYFVGQNFANAFTPPGNAGNLQAQMQAEINTIAAKYFWLYFPLTIVGLGISGAMTTGGAGLLALKPWARILLRRVLMLAIVVEGCKGVVYVLNQLEMMPIMQDYLQKIMAESGGVGGRAFGPMFSIMMLVGIGVWVVWALFKIGLMLWGNRYLARPSTRAYFEAE